MAKLDNKNTRFSKFRWGEDEHIRRAIQEVRDKMYPQPLPVRFKIRLGQETRNEKLTENKE